MQINMQENGKRWGLERASINGGRSWLITNESGMAAENVYLGINAMDAFAEKLFLDDLDEVYSTWVPSPTDFLRIGWKTDIRSREVIGISFLDEKS